MALTKSILLDSGINLDEAYIKIYEVVFNNHSSYSSFANINVNIYKDKAARDTGKPEVIRCTYKVGGGSFTTYLGLNVLSQSGNNIISQAYEYLKTLDFYNGAVDIVDGKEV